MTTINKLTRTDSVSAGDLVPVYMQSQGDARAAAMSVILAYLQNSIVFPDPEFVAQYAAPSATGFTVQVSDGPANTHLILTPTGPLATGTISLPPVATLVDGQQIMVNTTQAVTALSFALNGSVSITGAPVGLSANDAFLLAYDLPTSAWYTVSRSVQNPATTNTAQTLTNKTISGGTIAGTQLLAVDIGGSSTGVLTGFTGLPILTGVAGLAAGIAAFLASPSSANLISAVTDETGTGSLVFGTAPTIAAPIITGVAVVPTAAPGTNTTQPASTAFIQAAITALNAYVKTNILGTVSQSAGVPTGAILETGSVSGARFAKYADGTLVCEFMGSSQIPTNSAVGSIFSSAAQNFTFPATFISAPVVIPLTSASAVAVTWGAVNATPTTTTCQVVALGPVNTATALVGYVARGRWF